MFNRCLYSLVSFAVLGPVVGLLVLRGIETNLSIGLFLFLMSFVGIYLVAVNRISYSLHPFMALVPMLGLLVWLAVGRETFRLIGVVGAYVLGIVPASIGGVIHLSLIESYLSILKQKRVSIILSAAFGTAAGCVASLIQNMIAGFPAIPQSPGMQRLWLVGCATGLVCGCIYSYAWKRKFAIELFTPPALEPTGER